MIIIVFGLPGSGKSYFAARLASMIDAEYIMSDRIRKEMLDKRTYSDEEKLSVYDEMLLQTTEAIKLNKNVVLDATFYKENIRSSFVSHISTSESIRFIEVVADESLIRERLQRVREESEANFEVYKKIKEEWQPMEDPHLILQSTNDNIEEMLHKTATYLHIEK